MAPDRRTLLADAALGVLADEGMRGLTHRAVDRAAALPPGTTSAYFRTRAALLTALVTRLVHLDQSELRAAAERLPPLRTADDLVDALARLSRRRLTGEGRRRSLARYACTIESVRAPELREILVPRENAARDTVRRFLARHGVPDVESRTRTLLICVDGLVLDRLVHGGRVPREVLEDLVAGALRTGPKPSSVPPGTV
ncbi:TetR family transcriptional regulator C-terminal domain-containing protein [Streptomyces griseoviridis]|uniref:DNA-binding transcriptional regulator YbjK n=3 Tax=Streptomyces TaxID=1883 RepID=A0ABT9LAH4_STRGD|nr:MULTISPECIES: TetR family transcriptional regulator C-terminal domain-containing protein [Streptomyces]MDP9679536.1 DNA-binding transcriptional regulator YbjK [Streptomyces griseoviridis]GGS40445.1 putative transcriptional regulator, TetR family protein [Streptomyces niveoruber]GGT00416.1 putative transcriptional regulator, TetR family protein [Streptomyces griseoviridis]GGU24567.1 putative transcriptional regulator, TetR family protein [Streptomyces daghestanicus]GHI29803.1 putative transc